MLTIGAHAAEWQPIEKNETFTSYIDRASQRREMTVYIAWIKNVNAKPQRLRHNGSTASYVQKLELVQMDCEKRRYVISKGVYSSGNGVTVATDNGTTGYEPVVPESSSEAQYIAMCGTGYDGLKALRDKGIEYKPLIEPKKNWSPFSK
jgi:hypothetical protein